MTKRVASVIGLGLIGGSVARGLQASAQFDEVVGYDHDAKTLALALELQVVQRVETSLQAALADTDLVVIAVPTMKAAELLEQVLQYTTSSTVVTDVASVKGPVLDASSGAPNFVGGHPIAGSERSGVEASRADLFHDHRVILTPTEATSAEALAMVREFWTLAGAEVVDMDVQTHDAILASTSHLPHMLAYALVDALSHSTLCDDIFRFAAGGFRDFTRIASSDPIMWRDIALANRDELLRAIDSFSDHLGTLRESIENGEAEALETCFADARDARDAFIKRQAS